MDQISLNQFDDNYLSIVSVGTKAVIDSLCAYLTNLDDDTDIVMINLSTINRNVCHQTVFREEYKNNLNEDLINKIKHYSYLELMTLIYEIKSIFQYKPPCQIPRYILLYTYQYNKIIPNQYYRENPDKLLRFIESTGQYTSENNFNAPFDNACCIEFHAGCNAKIYSILDAIEMLKNFHNVIMVSHHPIDYHICNKVNQFGVIKSFTGDYLTKDMLSEKVFSSKYLPFLPQIHVLLGDKVDIKPALKLNMRKTILDLAQKESWYLMSEEDIINRLHQLNIFQPYNPL